MRSRFLAALATLVLTVAGLVTAQTALWPPILLDQPSDRTAPATAVFTLGGTGRLQPRAITTDAQDNIYIAGSGRATDVPGLENGMKPRHERIDDAFVAKLDRQGRRSGR